jgi:hypothetical protein
MAAVAMAVIWRWQQWQCGGDGCDMAAVATVAMAARWLRDGCNMAEATIDKAVATAAIRRWQWLRYGGDGCDMAVVAVVMTAIVVQLMIF